jgi:GPN-loop GTPase
MPRERNMKSAYYLLSVVSRCSDIVAVCSREYLPELERQKEARQKVLDEAKADSMNRMMGDLDVDRARNPQGAAADWWDPNEEEEEDDDDLDLNLIDKSELAFTAER